MLTLDRPVYRSHAWLFEYYQCSSINSYQIFHTKEKEYGTVHYVTEHHRSCGWFETMAKVLSYCTVLIPCLIWILQKSLEPKGTFEVWSRDKHFQQDDIQNLYSKSLGLRHVSSREKAIEEKQKGFSLGCSFSLKPLTEEQSVIEFEQSINQHFVGSFRFDIGPIDPRLTVIIPLLDKLENCCFMLVDYSPDFLKPIDIDVWGGLGRYPKWSTHSNQIQLLPFFQKEDFNFSPPTITSKAEGERFFDALLDHWRMNLLVQLRSI